MVIMGYVAWVMSGGGAVADAEIFNAACVEGVCEVVFLYALIAVKMYNLCRYGRR